MLQKLKKFLTSKTLIIFLIFLGIPLVPISIYNIKDDGEINEPTEVIEEVNETVQEETESLKQEQVVAEQEVIKETETLEQAELTEEIPEGLHFEVDYRSTFYDIESEKQYLGVVGKFVGTDLGKYEQAFVTFHWATDLGADDEQNGKFKMFYDLSSYEGDSQLIVFEIKGYESDVLFPYDSFINITVEGIPNEPINEEN